MKARIDAQLYVNEDSYPVPVTIERTDRNEIAISPANPDYAELPDIRLYVSDVDAAALAGALAAILGGGPRG